MILQDLTPEFINGHPDLKQDAALIASIPGLGDTTVAKVLAYAGDVRRFTNGRALAAFIGVTPRQRESGSSVKGRTMLSRTGHAAVRTLSGMVALKHNPVCKCLSEDEYGWHRRPDRCRHEELVHLIYGVVKSTAVDAKIALQGLASRRYLTPEFRQARW